MAQNNAKIKELGKLSFEEALERLESTVRSMEGGNAKLEEMIGKFEEGRLLAALCQKKLDELKQKIELLTRDTAEGGEWKELRSEGIVESKNDFIPSSENEDSLFD